MSTRRTFIGAVGAMLLTASPFVSAQVAGKRRVSFLGISSFNPIIAQFAFGLRELGWIEGSNLILDMRFAQGDVTRWAPLTGELLALQPDVFVTTADYMAEAAAAATKTIPIVFVIGTDPVGRGLVRSLARPGSNVTGFSVQDNQLFPKRMALLKEAIPGLDKVGVFVGSRDRFGLEYLEDARRKLGLVFVPAFLAKPDDIDVAFETFSRAGVKGVMDYSGGGMTFHERERVAALAIKHRMPMFGQPPVADSGVLLTYGADVLAVFKRAASLVDRILKGANPADIPIEQVDVYELVINLRTARALGIELPRSLVLQATRVIE